jgi:metallo-beta-lactamase family protein
MKIHFLGANRQVTGSRYCLELNHSKILIDCGMFQERPYLDRNWEPSPIPPSEIDAVVLTHVHIDHCGLIPKLVSEGFSGPIYCTRPSVQLAEVVLRDAARIQTEDVKFKKKRHEKEGRRGKHPEIPLFDDSDVDHTIPLLKGVPYQRTIQINDSVSVTFHEAGHILGSAMLEFQVKESAGATRIVFSGDIGQWDKPLIRDPTLFDEADYVVMETTYGDHNHPSAGDIETQLETVINETVSNNGNVVIPTFAVERAQELVYYIGRLAHAKRIPYLDVFLDSPMAVDVTDVFRNHRDCLDEETWKLIMSNEPPLKFPGLHLVSRSQDSKAINDRRKPCIIMATSGMCTAGRIKHHLRKNIGRAESTILFVGYQAHGTLGRQILEGNSLVRIHGREWKVKARVSRIDGFSGHADQAALLRWIGNLKQAPRQVFLTHGDEDASQSFAEELRRRFSWPGVSLPHYQEVVTIDAGSGT